MKDEKVSPILSQHYKSEEYKFHKQALEEFEKMSEEEKLNTFVKAGIYNKKFELTEDYGGSGELEKDR